MRDIRQEFRPTPFRLGCLKPGRRLNSDANDLDGFSDAAESGTIADLRVAPMAGFAMETGLRTPLKKKEDRQAIEGIGGE